MSHRWETVTHWFWLQDLNTHSHESVGHQTTAFLYDSILLILYFSFYTSTSFSILWFPHFSVFHSPVFGSVTMHKSYPPIINFTASLGNSSWLVLTMESRMNEGALPQSYSNLLQVCLDSASRYHPTLSNFLISNSVSSNKMHVCLISPKIDF